LDRTMKPWESKFPTTSLDELIPSRILRKQASDFPQTPSRLFSHGSSLQPVKLKT